MTFFSFVQNKRCKYKYIERGFYRYRPTDYPLPCQTYWLDSVIHSSLYIPTYTHSEGEWKARSEEQKQNAKKAGNEQSNRR